MERGFFHSDLLVVEGVGETVDAGGAEVAVGEAVAASEAARLALYSRASWVYVLCPPNGDLFFNVLDRGAFCVVEAIVLYGR